MERRQGCAAASAPRSLIQLVGARRQTLPPIRKVIPIEDHPGRYSEREFALILQKASQLAATPDGSRRPSTGFSLAEMKAIAADVGIDPALVEQAARLVAVGGALSTFERVIGGPVRYRRDFRVSGELTEAQATHLLAAIRAVAEQRGEGDATATGVSWSSRGEVSRTFVAAYSEKGGTRVRIGVDRSGGLLLTAFLNLMAGVLTASVVGAVLDPDSLAAGAAVLGSGIAGGLAAARTVWAVTTKRVRARLDSLVDAVGNTLDDTATASPAAPEPGSSDRGAS